MGGGAREHGGREIPEMEVGPTSCHKLGAVAFPVRIKSDALGNERGDSGLSQEMFLPPRPERQRVAFVRAHRTQQLTVRGESQLRHARAVKAQLRQDPHRRHLPHAQQGCPGQGSAARRDDSLTRVESETHYELRMALEKPLRCRRVGDPTCGRFLLIHILRMVGLSIERGEVVHDAEAFHRIEQHVRREVEEVGCGGP